MLKQNGYAQYQNAKIMTASPAELTLMLYEGAIKFGNIAILAMENKDPAKAHENVVKVEKSYRISGKHLIRSIQYGKILKMYMYICFEDVMSLI